MPHEDDFSNAPSVPDTLQVSRNWRVRLRNVLANFHRNSCYPEATEADLDMAIGAVMRAIDNDARMQP